MEYPSDAGEEYICGAAVGGQVHGADTGGILVAAWHISQLQERDAGPIVHNGNGVGGSIVKVEGTLVKKKAGAGVEDLDCPVA